MGGSATPGRDPVTFKRRTDGAYESSNGYLIYRHGEGGWLVSTPSVPGATWAPSLRSAKDYVRDVPEDAATGPQDAPGGRGVPRGERYHAIKLIGSPSFAVYNAARDEYALLEVSSAAYSLAVARELNEGSITARGYDWLDGSTLSAWRGVPVGAALAPSAIMSMEEARTRDVLLALGLVPDDVSSVVQGAARALVRLVELEGRAG